MERKKILNPNLGIRIRWVLNTRAFQLYYNMYTYSWTFFL
nr:MAG TPA: hypothetical protein [Caudoviricetes sp.]